MSQHIAILGTRGIPEIQGGVERHVQELCAELVRLEFNVTVFCRSCYFKSKKKAMEYNGVQIKYIYTPKRKSIEAIYHTFFGVLYARFLKIDVLHMHAIGPALLVPFARLLGLKVVFTHHGPDYERQKWGRLAKSVLRLGERFGVKYANKVIVISNVIKDHIEALYSRFDAELIHNGVRVPTKSNSVDYIESLGIKRGLYLLSVARLVEEKGLHDLIRAYEKCNLVSRGYKLVIAGDADHESDYSKSLKKLAENTAGVVMPGYVVGDDLNQLYTNCKLFVLPSYHEGLPISLLEALSYDCDILVSNIPPHLEIPLEKEDYFEVKNIDALGRALELKIKMQKKLKNHFNILEREYNWENIGKKTARVYLSLK